MTFVGPFPLFLCLRTNGTLLRLESPGPVVPLAVTLAISCAAMTWIVMPTLTRALAGWLYGRTSRP